MSNAVVLMAYGSPERLEDVPAYYADIRGGRPIRPELLDALVERYRALDQPGDGAVEVAAAADPLPERRQPVLPAADRGGHHRLYFR